MIGKGKMAGNGISKFYESVVGGEFFTYSLYIRQNAIGFSPSQDDNEY